MLSRFPHLHWAGCPPAARRNGGLNQRGRRASAEEEDSPVTGDHGWHEARQLISSSLSSPAGSPGSAWKAAPTQSSGPQGRGITTCQEQNERPQGRRRKSREPQEIAVLLCCDWLTGCRHPPWPSGRCSFCPALAWRGAPASSPRQRPSGTARGTGKWSPRLRMATVCF